MHRLISRFVPLIALLLVVSGCGSNSDNVIVAPTPPTLTDTFTGTLTPNGGTTFAFNVTGSGDMRAQLTTLGPDSTKPVGLALGTWNGSICQLILAHDNAIQGSVVDGRASTVGSFCVRIYDAAGTVVDPQTYVIDVFHQ